MSTPMPYGSSTLPLLPQPYKDTTAAWLLWFFLGHLGAHNFYLRRPGQAVGMLALTLIGWATVWLFIGLLPLFAVFVWWLVDAFLLTGRLHWVNRQIHAHNRLLLGARPIGW